MANADILRKNYSTFLQSEHSRFIGIPETSVENHAVPRFSIFDMGTGEKVKTLKSCFIKRVFFTRDNIPSQILASDGLVYTAVYDCRIPDVTGKIEFIISFQQHTYGRFAIVRLAKKNSNKGYKE
jgi:hypothetical protein